MDAWTLFLGAALWMVAGFGFIGWMLHRTNGLPNWGGDVTHTPTEDERIWLDLVERRKKRGAA
jgi:hypothetical protein